MLALICASSSSPNHGAEATAFNQKSDTVPGFCFRKTLAPYNIQFCLIRSNFCFQASRQVWLQPGIKKTRMKTRQKMIKLSWNCIMKKTPAGLYEESKCYKPFEQWYIIGHKSRWYRQRPQEPLMKIRSIWSTSPLQRGEGWGSSGAEHAGSLRTLCRLRTDGWIIECLQNASSVSQSTGQMAGMMEG